MGNINDLLNVGSGILSDVTRAIETGNYGGLGERTKERVNYAATQFATTAAGAATTVANAAANAAAAGSRAGTSAHHPAGSSAAHSAGTSAPHPAGPAASHPAGMRTSSAYVPNYHRQAQNVSHFLSGGKQGSGIAQIITGGIGAFLGTVGSLTSFGLAGAFQASLGAVGTGLGFAAAGSGIFFAALFFLSLGLIHSGIRTRKLIRKYYEYGAAIGNVEYFNIKNLAERLGLSAKEVTKNIEKMIRRNLLPGARMDRRKETVLLTENAYQLYQQAEASRVEREARQQLRGEAPVTETEHLDGDVKRIIDDGNRAIVQIRAINDEIPDTQIMSDKLYRLEEIMRRIFEQVKKDPSTAPDLRRFMDYYLPTTTKLLSAYVEMDKQPVQGETIKKSKAEIESSLDTINDAFEQLLDGMFSDMALDISTDISVMKTMMAQDGLATEANPLFDGTGELKFGS